MSDARIEAMPDYTLLRYYITLIRCSVGLESLPKDDPRQSTVVELIIEEHKGMLDDLWKRFTDEEREVVDIQVMQLRNWLEHVIWTREDYRDEMIRQWRHARLETKYGARVVLEALLDQFFPGWRVQA